MKMLMTFAKSRLAAFALLASLLIVPVYSFAQEVAQSDGTQDFISMLAKDIQDFGGASAVAKVSMVIMLLIASTKVNLVNSMLWNKVPDSMKKFVGPLLGALGGLASLYMAGKPVTMQALSVWVLAGAGAPILHELLDAVKLIPGIGPTYVAVINLVEGFLDQKKTQTV